MFTTRIASSIVIALLVIHNTNIDYAVVAEVVRLTQFLMQYFYHPRVMPWSYIVVIVYGPITLLTLSKGDDFLAILNSSHMR